MEKFLYPPSPVNVNPGILSTTAAFKKQVGKVISCIILFFIVYLLLVLISTCLAIACFYFGAMLIITVPRFFTIMIGLGLMALGISVVFFLIKFIFAVSKNSNASGIEIKEQEQPGLFAFIYKINSETKTPFAKKIFLISDVNASVFYNSSFWSMFLPIRKNLNIGLGLINSVNISEFKAVVAHEFGHFSQRSMKLGSFTYNVNQIIYNMLYNNTGYTTFLNSWGNVNKYFSFFASITIKIAMAIQWVLRQMYRLINKNYLGLSREMEFHADAVSASVAGGNNLIAALSRIELASGCYNSALNNAGDWLKEKKATKNIFKNQLTIFQSMAKEYKLPLKDNLPQVSFHFIQSFSQSRINYKDQWASHPTLAERKQHLDKVNVDVPPDETSAWHIFSNIEELQEQVTANLYQHTNTKGTLEKCDGEYFEEIYNKQRESSLLPTAYLGFYDSRFINVKDWNLDVLTNTEITTNFEELFNDENGQVQSLITNNERDITTLQAIKEKRIDVKTFDFDGIKHTTRDCDNIINRLEEDVKMQTKKQEELDKEAFVFFYNNAVEAKEEIKNNYKHYITLYTRYDDYSEVANKVLETINPFYHGVKSLQAIRESVSELKVIHEKNLKQYFRKLLDDKVITSDSTSELMDRMIAFNKTDFTYFEFDTFKNEELTELSGLTLKVAEELNKQKFKWYKKLLEHQIDQYKTTRQ